MMDADQIKLLRWRCRRGTLELDLMLTRYLDQQYPQATPQQQHAFQDLLALEDSELMRYLLGGVQPQTREWIELVANLLAVK